MELSDKNLKGLLNMDEVVHTDDHDIQIRLKNEYNTVEVNGSEEEKRKVNDQVPCSRKSYDHSLKQIACLKRLQEMTLYYFNI